MSLAGLRAFDAVVASGGFSAAARMLGVSQPAVSARLAALERRYDVRLIDRRTGAPTQLGAALYGITHELFSLAERADRLLADANELMPDRVRVAVDAPGYAMPVLAAVRRRQPQMSFDVQAGNAQQVVDAVREGRAEIGFAANAPEHPDLHRAELRTQDLAAVVRTDHARAGDRTLRLADLVDESLIGREAGSVTRSALEDAARDAGLTIRFDMIAGSREAVLAAAAAGLGVSVVAEDEMLDDPRLVMLDLREPVISVAEHLICRRGDERTPLWRAMTAAAAVS